MSICEGWIAILHSKPSTACALRCGTQAIGIGNAFGEGAVDRHHAEGWRQALAIRAVAKMPEVVPVPLACAAAVRVAQHDVVCGGRTDRALKAAEIELVVAAAEHQRAEPPAGLCDGFDIGNAARRFDQPHDGNFSLARGGGFGAVDHHLDGVHVGSRFHISGSRM